MRKPEDIKNLVKKTLEKYKRIDILINNAGQAIYGSVEKINIDHLKQIIDLNVYSVILAMQEVIPIMRNQKNGMIINISSMVSKRNIPGIAGYSSTKSALNSISNIARQELVKDNIIVSSVFPKTTATRFRENAVTPAPDWSKSGRPMPEVDTAEKVAEKIAEAILTGAEEIIV